MDKLFYRHLFVLLLKHQHYPGIQLYVIYVTWAGGICLICTICTHEPGGAQRGHIRKITTAHVTYVMYQRKIALHYIGKDGAFDYGI